MEIAGNEKLPAKMHPLVTCSLIEPHDLIALNLSGKILALNEHNSILFYLRQKVNTNFRLLI